MEVVFVKRWSLRGGYFSRVLLWIHLCDNFSISSTNCPLAPSPGFILIFYSNIVNNEIIKKNFYSKDFYRWIYYIYYVLAPLVIWFHFNITNNEIIEKHIFTTQDYVLTPLVT